MISGVGANRSLAIKAALPSGRSLRLETLAGIPWRGQWAEGKGDGTSWDAVDLGLRGSWRDDDSHDALRREAIQVRQAKEM